MKNTDRLVTLKVPVWLVAGIWHYLNLSTNATAELDNLYNDDTFTFKKFHGSYSDMRDWKIWDDISRKVRVDPYKDWQRTQPLTIAGHEVMELKLNSAKIGCTVVTRKEVLELLKQMDSAK